MQTVENTHTGWSEVIAELKQKHASAMTHIEHLRAQKYGLALDASLGNEDAKKRLTKLVAELTRLSYEIDDLNVASPLLAIRRRVPRTPRMPKPS